VKLHEPGQSLSFLGFTLRYDRDLYGRDHRYLNVFPSHKAMARAHERLRELTGPKRCFVPIRQMVGDLNRWMKGWSGYFRYGYPRKSFREINHFALLRSTRHLRRRSQRAYRTPAGESSYAHLQRLGLRLL
jgi:RNA-directed DNA polymerase